MNLARQLSIVAIAAAVLVTADKSADASNIRGAVHVGNRVHVQFGVGAGHHRHRLPGHGHVGPIHPRPGHLWHPGPPARPVFVYLVYQRDYHGHWILAGRYHARHAAYAAAGRLRHHGYPSYVRRDRGLGAGGIYSADPGYAVGPFGR